MIKEKIILFDGVCNLCNSSVQFVIRHDKKQIFTFSSLQSEFGQKTLNKNGLDPNNFSSFLYLENNTLHTKSSASLRVSKELSGIIKLLYIFIVIPKPIRDWIYSIVAKNRYKWFGKQDSCWIPTPELKSRFI